MRGLAPFVNTIDYWKSASLKSVNAWNPHIIVDDRNETYSKVFGKKIQFFLIYFKYSTLFVFFVIYNEKSNSNYYFKRVKKAMT